MDDVILEAAMTLIRHTKQIEGAGKMSIVFDDKEDKPLYGVFTIVEPELIVKIRETIKEFDKAGAGN